MPSSIKISPPNSMLFVSDPTGGMVPDIVPGKWIWSTQSCISFGCLMEQDGPTEVTLGQTRDVDPGMSPSFAGTLSTPSQVVVVSTSEGESILETKVSKAVTRVRIWVNRSKEPDRVIIGLD